MFKVKREIEVKFRKEPIEIIPIGDLHNGSPNCRFDKFKKMVDYIEKSPQTYVIGMGDYLDCILSTDKRYDSNASSGSITQHKLEVLTQLKRIKDKIICLMTGNHEYKFAQWGYGDPTQYLAQELGVPYAGMSCFIKLKIPWEIAHKAPLIIYAHHGWFSGRKRGSKVDNIEDLMRDYDADCYLCGHSHDLFATRRARISWEGDKSVVFANTGSFVQTASFGTSNYSERAGYPPQKLGVVKIKWYWQTGDIRISE